MPRKSENVSYSLNEEGKGIVTLENVGFYNRLAQKIFKRPKYSNIELEEYGTFIWQYIDGEKDIYDIALKVKENFGVEAEPLYERICKYFRILSDNSIVKLDKK